MCVKISQNADFSTYFLFSVFVLLIYLKRFNWIHMTLYSHFQARKRMWNDQISQIVWICLGIITQIYLKRIVAIIYFNFPVNRKAKHVCGFYHYNHNHIFSWIAIMFFIFFLFFIKLFFQLLGNLLVYFNATHAKMTLFIWITTEEKILSTAFSILTFIFSLSAKK